MKIINKTLFQALLATLAWPAANAMAMPVDQTRCEFEQLTSANLKVHVRDLNTLYVPRDARIGTTIGTPELFEATLDQPCPPVPDLRRADKFQLPGRPRGTSSPACG